MAMSATDQRVTLARRIFERTGDRQSVIDGMVGLGYGRAEAHLAADHVAPLPARETPAPAAGSKPADEPPKGATLAPTRPDPTAASSSASQGRGSGLFAAANSDSLPSPTLTIPRRLTGRDAAGFGAGVLLYILALQFIQYGPSGPKGWLGAKFLNRPYTPDPAAELDASPLPDGNSTNYATPSVLTTTRPAVAPPPEGSA